MVRARGAENDTYAFDRTQPRGGRLLDRHPAADGVRLAARRPRLLLHATPTCIARYQRMRGKSRLLPDGLGRQRPADRASGAELLRRALRPVAALRPDFTPPARSRTRRQPGRRSAGPTSSSCASELTVEDEKAFEALWRQLGLSVDWYHDLHDHRRPLARPSASGPSCATSPAARPTRPRRRPCGTSRSRPPSPRPSSRPATTPAHYHRVAFHRRRRHARSTSRPPAPS